MICFGPLATAREEPHFVLINALPCLMILGFASISLRHLVLQSGGQSGIRQMTSRKVFLCAYPFLDKRSSGAPWIPTSAQSVGSVVVAFQTPRTSLHNNFSW